MRAVAYDHFYGYDELTDTLRAWAKQGAIDAGRRDGLTTDERQELGRLRREVKRLQEEREILKKAAAFFAAESVTR